MKDDTKNAAENIIQGKYITYTTYIEKHKDGSWGKISQKRSYQELMNRTQMYGQQIRELFHRIQTIMYEYDKFRRMAQHESRLYKARIETLEAELKSVKETSRQSDTSVCTPNTGRKFRDDE